MKLSGKIKAHSREIFGFGDVRMPSTHYFNRHPNPEHAQDIYFMCVEFRDHEREEWEEGVGVRVRAGVGSGVGVGVGGGRGGESEWIPDSFFFYKKKNRNCN